MDPSSVTSECEDKDPVCLFLAAFLYSIISSFSFSILLIPFNPLTFFIRTAAKL